MAAPFFANAASKDLRSLITDTIIPYVNDFIYLLMGVGVVMFVFYVVKYFIASGDSTKRAEAGSYVMYSVIGFFIVLSFWGLVNILKNTFNLDNSSASGSWSQDFNNVFPTGSNGGGAGGTVASPTGDNGVPPIPSQENPGL